MCRRPHQITDAFEEWQEAALSRHGDVDDNNSWELYDSNALGKARIYIKDCTREGT